MDVLRTEGEDNGEWIIVDCGAAVVHVMQQPIREYYRLEEIWGGKPVKLKLGSQTKGLVKASEPDDEADEPAPKRAPAKKAAAKKAAAQPAAPARKAVAQKVPAKKVASKTATAATAARKKEAEQRQINRIPAAKTVVVKKAPARKVAAKTAGRTTAKAAPARKTAKSRG